GRLRLPDGVGPPARSILNRSAAGDKAKALHGGYHFSSFSKGGAETRVRAVGRRSGDKGGAHANTALTSCPLTVVRGVASHAEFYCPISPNDGSPVFHPSNFSSGFARAQVMSRPTI